MVQMFTISTHTPLAGRDFRPALDPVSYVKFLLTRPLRDVTKMSSQDPEPEKISTHTPLAGRDGVRQEDRRRERFLLTRPLRDVTSPGCAGWWHAGISTHTPLAGRDAPVRTLRASAANFYSHAPCGT